MRPDINYVAVDFGADDLGERLAGAGWSSDERSIFVWEGVSNHLSKAAVASVRLLVSRAALGSLIVFTHNQANKIAN